MLISLTVAPKLPNDLPSLESNQRTVAWKCAKAYNHSPDQLTLLTSTTRTDLAIRYIPITSSTSSPDPGTAPWLMYQLEFRGQRLHSV